MIFNIRGGFGTGKSTIVKSLLEKYSAEELDHNARGKPQNYKFYIDGLNKPFFVVGSYVTACGGCDGIQPYAKIWPRVETFAEQGHVIFEGVVVSSSYGNIGRDSEKYGDDIIFCFMDTPLNESLRRVRKRRLDRGDTRPFNSKNTVIKWVQVFRRSIKHFEKAQRNWCYIDHTRALESFEELLLKAEDDK